MIKPSEYWLLPAVVVGLVVYMVVSWVRVVSNAVCAAWEDRKCEVFDW